jgi:hypothetical protein
MSKKTKHGSFYARTKEIQNLVPDTICLDRKEAFKFRLVEKLVNPLSQAELADGWQQVVRRPDYHYKKIVRGDMEYRKKVFNYDYMKVNLAQLPEHLEHKLKPVYEENIFSHYSVREQRHVYIVSRTVVDDEICELKYLVNQKCLNLNDIDRIKDLLQVLQDNEVYGWPIIRAKKLIEEHLESM